MFRSGESLSPKRELEECLVVGVTRSSGESVEFLGESDLAQASVTRLSEKSRLVWCVVLAQARLPGCLNGELVGVPWVVARNVSLADEYEEPLSCGSGWRVLPSWDVTDYVHMWELHLGLRCVIRSMVSARALSVVANRGGSKAH
ncbi:hypothetical protein DEO72_LG8g1184 [Vigna unguiculata]|uniref:Uncharacterized protein n=1 Tax=Vigna unguiculata TaxID=3917 RepID=A0A4D6MRF1_VIGUN|nr:hypothetical protein DEO72_LG8g1184 [Vigna unguiculata]